MDKKTLRKEINNYLYVLATLIMVIFFSPYLTESKILPIIAVIFVPGTIVHVAKRVDQLAKSE